MGDGTSPFNFALIFLLHVGPLASLFLLALFRPMVKPLLSSSIPDSPRLARVTDKTPLVLIFLGAILAQGAFSDSLGWIDPWFWPLVALAAVALWRFPSFWFVLLFYFFHYNFSFDGPRLGATCTTIKFEQGELAFVQDRYLDRVFGNYTTGFDEICGTYRSWGLIELEGEVFGFDLTGDQRFYRPKVNLGESPGELAIVFCPKHYLAIHPNRTCTEYRNGKMTPNTLDQWSGHEDLKSAINKIYKNYPIVSQNYLHSFILYFIYPVFFMACWCVSRFREQFAANVRFYLGQWCLIFLAYLLSGVPAPVYWPMVLMVLGWLRNRENGIFSYLLSSLIVLWIVALSTSRIF